MNKTSLRSLIALTCLAAGIASAETTYDFNIRTDSLSDALKEFASQSGLQVVYFARIATNQPASPVSGALSAEAALQKLLAPSNLTFERIDAKTIAIRDSSTERSRSTSSGSPAFQKTSAVSIEPRYVRVAEARELMDGESSTRSGASVSHAERIVDLEEVLVTGSHIRGAKNFSSPVITFDRKDIEASGYATTQQFIQSLPQNLNNVSDTTFGGINGGLNRPSFGGSGPNLRGLGSDSTLVLLNGRRLASAGGGAFVDLSLVPLSAIERIEMLTDGASALYGSDAVGGVVNLILRKDFEGAETRVRYGTVTAGDHDERQLGQSLGTTWDAGHAMASYEYYDRSALDGADRSFYRANEFLPHLKLIPEQERHGVLLSGTHRFSERAEASIDLRFGKRQSGFSYNQSIPLNAVSEVEQYGGTVELSLDLISRWQARISGTFDKNAAWDTYTQVSDGALYFERGNSSRFWSTDAILDGPIGSLSGGEIRFAVGGQFRSEEFDEADPQYPALIKRDVLAAYAELQLPWVQANNARTGVRRLETTLAARFEDYSDFGSTFNPKIGLAWEPIDGLNLRGTWGTSFKAPQFLQMNPGDRGAVVYLDKFVDEEGFATAMLLVGSGRSLKPETAKNVTLGFDFRPPSQPSLEITSTYFEIDYEDRIRAPISDSYDFFGVLLDPNFSSIVNRNPDAGYLASRLGDSKAWCYDAQFDSCDLRLVVPADIHALVDGRLTNLAEHKMRGIDLSAGYRIVSKSGAWDFRVSGTRLLENKERLLPGLPHVELLDQVWQPVDLRMRGSVSYGAGAWNTALFVNYVDSYKDERTNYLSGSQQRSRVASWTTLDISVHYDLTDIPMFQSFDGVEIALSATNVLDRDPPYVSHQFGLNFDGVNANPLGRFIALQLVSRW